MRKNAFLSLILVLAMLLTLILPAGPTVYAVGNSTTIDVSDTINMPANVTYNNGIFTINDSSVSTITVTGMTTENTIAVATGVTGLTLILNNLSIINPLSSISPINLQSNTEVTIQLASGTVNILNASTRDTLAGLCVPSTATVTINGTGSLTATGGKWGAGIGGGSGATGGTINISSGTVTATGGQRGAGIGGGNTCPGGTVSISGGTVTATGGQSAAGIGGGNTGAGGTINISGGTVTAIGGQGGAGIGGGGLGASGVINITGTSVVMAASDSSRPAIHAGSGNGNVINATLNNVISANPTYLKCNGNKLTFPGNYKNFAFSAASASAVSAYSDPTYTAILGNIMTNPAGAVNIPVTNLSTNPSDVTPVIINIATITVKKDGSAWTTGTPTMQLSTSNSALQDVISGTGSNGVYTFTGLDPAKTYYVWDTASYTNKSVSITSLNNATVNYYTTQFAVNDAGTASGSTIAATYNSSAISVGDVVLGGKQLVITVIGHGSSSYTYAWSGTGTSGQTTAELTIATLSSSVNATCTVTGAPASTTINVGDSSGTNLPTGVTYASNLFTIGTGANNSTITVTGTTTTNTITVAPGVSNLTLILSDVSITSTVVSPMNLQGNANVMIQLVDGSTNTLTESGANSMPGLCVPSTATVVINGTTGTLTATGGSRGAGIGGENNGAGGTININGGTVTATSSGWGAGIGGGFLGVGGNITINGGTVNATGGQYSAGIGGGYMGTSGGNITINGGTVNATGGQAAAGIGGGSGGAGGNININAGTVKATGNFTGAGIGGGDSGAGGTLTITGSANVTAIGGTTTGGLHGGAGIGGGYLGTGGTINISGTPIIIAAAENNKPAIDVVSSSGNSVINAQLNIANGSSAKYLKCNGNVLRFPAYYKSFAFSSAADSVVNAYTDLSCTNFSGSIVTNPGNVAVIPLTNPTVATPVMFYTITITANKDGGTWTSGSPTLKLSTSSATYQNTKGATPSNGVYTFTGLDSATTYYVWDQTNNLYTNQSILCPSASATLNYYTVNFAVADAGVASGSTIVAIYNSSAISAGKVVLGGKQLVITATGQGAGAGSYTYAWSGAGTSGETTASMTIANLGSSVNATCTVTGIPATYTATINLKKDGSTWTSSGKTITLQQASEAPTATIEASGVFTANLVNGTWKILADGVDTGATVVINNGAASQNLNYYTVNFAVADAGVASGSTIVAIYNSSAISSGAVVLGGKQLVITATGQGAGAGSYTYAWSGAGTSGETTASMTIANLGSSVNATCTVTGIPATYTAAVNLKKDGSAWTSSGKTITLQQASEAPTATTEASGVFTANLVNGTWKILADGVDTGATVVINNGAASQNLNYYTVNFGVADTGVASGSTIAASYNSSVISAGDVVLGGKQLVITAVGQGAGAGSYTYAWSGAGTSGETTASMTIANLGSSLNATCTVTGIPATYTATVNLKKDGSAWTGSGKTITLQQASEAPTATTEVNGIFTANVVNGIWKILADGVDTGATAVINNGAASQNLNYYTVNFGVADAGVASGSTIAATYNSSAISSGDILLGGKQLVIIAIGQGAGAGSYTYAWSGAGTSGETTASMTIANLGSSVNATCTVTGIPATYTATVNLKKDGSAWTTSGKTITLQQASEVPTATTEASGVFTANVVNGTWKILADGVDTGATAVINNGAASQNLNYYTVNFGVADAGVASGSTIVASYNSSAINSGDVVLSGKQLVITATGQGAGAGSYTYAWSGAGTSGETTAAMTIPSLGSPVNATCTVTGIPATYIVTVNLKKDGSAWTGSGKTITLQQASEAPTSTTEASGVFTANVINGTWKILLNGADTGATVVINNGVQSKDINYYTVNFGVADAGVASGSTIAATYNSSAISAGDVVLGGKQLVITATCAGAGSYTYAWSGAGTSGETTAAMTIPSLGSPVNATCTVTGIPATYIVTVNLKKDGSAWTGSGKTITLQQASEAPTATTEVSGVFTANVVNGTWKILADGVDTGATAVINNGAASQNLNYYTVNFGVADAGVASGSTIAATYNSSAISSGDILLGGKQLVIIAIGQGASSYIYTWTVNSVPDGTFLPTMTISSLNYPVNAICNVGGIGMPPAITTASLQDGTVGTAYDQTLTATGTAPITWSITAGVLPAGLSLNTSTGEITGTPTTAGTATFTVKASNGTLPDATQALSITINPSSIAPAITTVSLQDGTVGTAYDQVLAATGTAPITWSISASVLPGGLSLNASTGEITGTPTTTGTATFTVKASNGTLPDATQILSITINPGSTAPAITTASLQNGTVGTAYDQTLAVTGTAPITWSIASGSLPGGLSLNTSTGEITGTPTAAGTATFTVKASNGTLPDSTQAFSITINPSSIAPAITTVSLQDGTVGTAYDQVLAATGTVPITWSIASGALPAGLSLNTSTGEITGTPTAAGTATFTVKASNGTLPDATQAFSITINPSSIAPAITTVSLQDGTVGTAYDQVLAATGTAPITWSIASGALPAGLSLNTSTGAITGTPTIAVAITFTVEATNSNGSDTKTYMVAITAPPVTYTVTITAGSGGTVSSTGGTYAAGEPVNISATPDGNYTFSGWITSNGGSFANASSASTTFTMPANNTVITAAFTYNGGSGGIGGGTPTPAPTQVPIIVDNNNYYIGNIAVESNTATITVDQSEFDKQLAAAKFSVVIPVTTEAKTVVAQLVVKNVQDMNVKGIPLCVQTGNVSYNIPASSIDTRAILSVLGATDPSLAPVNVIIKTDVGSETQEFVNSAVKAAGVEEVVPAVQFEITTSYNGKTHSIENFDHFVSRSVEITAEQAQQITTAIVVNPDGTTRHVPTFVYQKAGKWYAQINSLTNSTYALIFNQMSFTDSKGKWYQSVVDEMGSRKIISGIGNNCFAGDKAITRAEFAAIVVRALGLPANGMATFSDVLSDSWYSGAVATAAHYGIVSGIGDNKFAPDANITREEAMQMIFNASRLTPYVAVKGIDNTKNFTDYGTQSVWATYAVNFNLNNGFIQGYHGQFNPKSNITRAETAAVVLKLLQKSGLVDIRTRL